MPPNGGFFVPVTCRPAIARAFLRLGETMARITQQQLLQILPNAGKQAGVFASALNLAMDRYQINNLLRMAAFIAQVGHESGQFRYVKELGGDQYLSKYDTGPLAKRLGNTPEADGDGLKYRGRGLIQITGHDNYLACSKALFSDDRLLQKPELLEQAEWAAKSAAWFWNSRNLNALADAGDFIGITRRINGGTNGLAERQSLFINALKVLA
jgi:putative chitinase